MIVYIPIKKNSQRVPEKNFRTFKGKTLWENTVDKLNNFNVFIDTDSDSIIHSSKKKDWVTCFSRKRHLTGDQVSVVDLLKNFIDQFSIREPVCQIHVTSPFLNPDHIKFALDKINNEGYDSVFSADVVQNRFWRKESYGYCPVNHNPMKLEQTQDLPVYYMENSYLYAFLPKVLEYNNRIGYNPYIMEIGFPYNLDIDTEEDWKLVNVI
jgi:CMP-N-acetylneuraminic acid synthetase|tara:strand:- start:3778 stop:4407 length:630 start_codon:yes stop_codon:yes gene_type:complete